MIYTRRPCLGGCGAKVATAFCDACAPSGRSTGDEQHLHRAQGCAQRMGRGGAPLKIAMLGNAIDRKARGLELQTG